MIRPATHEDLESLVGLAWECHSVMPWGNHGLTINTDSIINAFLGFLESPISDLSVVDLGNGVSGACIVSVQPHLLDHGVLTAVEWMWHMSPSLPGELTKRRWVVKMLDHMLAFARAKGANIFKANTDHGDKALAALLARRGIRPMETACVGRL